MADALTDLIPQSGFTAAMNVLRMRPDLRIIVTAPGIERRRTINAPAIGTRFTVEIRLDSTGAVVTAHGTDSTRVLGVTDLAWPQSSIEDEPFFRKLTQAADAAWKQVQDAAVSS